MNASSNAQQKFSSSSSKHQRHSSRGHPSSSVGTRSVAAHSTTVTKKTTSFAGGGPAAESTAVAASSDPLTRLLRSVDSPSPLQRPPSYSSAGARKAREDTYKQLQKNISCLVTRKQEVQRHLALCLREDRTLASAVRGAQQRQGELAHARDALHSQLVQLSMISSAMSSVGRAASFRGRQRSSDVQQDRHHDPNNHTQSSRRPPFSFFGPQLALCQEHLGEASRSPSTAALDQAMVVTVQETLSTKESAAVFEHSARLEELEEILRLGVSEAIAVHKDLEAVARKGQHMVVLLDRAIDGEVQVQQGAFPRGVVGTGTTSMQHSSTPVVVVGRPADQRLNVVFVNASPLFPSMTIDDCHGVLAAMSTLCVAASEVSRTLRRTIENGHVSTALSSQALALQLSRGEKIALAKHEEAELLYRAASNEEGSLRWKKSELLEQLAQFQKRQEEIQHTLRLREALGGGIAATRGPSTSSMLAVAAFRGCSGKERSRSKSPSQFASLPSHDLSSRLEHPTSRTVDPVVASLEQVRGLLDVQQAEVVAKIAQLDVTLKRVRLEKQHHQKDAESSTIRSAACLSLSPARSPSRTPAQSPTIRSPRTF